MRGEGRGKRAGCGVCSRLVRGESEHDQVGVESVDHMLRVGLRARGSPHCAGVYLARQRGRGSHIVAFTRTLQPNMLHDLVLPLAGDRRVGENHLELPPARSALNSHLDEIAKPHCQPCHEASAGSDHIFREEGRG